MISSKGLVVDPKGEGVINKLTKEIPNLIFIRDMYHVFNLIVQEAVKEFPAYILQFVRNLCSYFNSGLRSNQVKAGVKLPLEMPTHYDKRWKFLLQCIEKILNFWKYLEICLVEDDSPLKEEIQDPEHYLYVYLFYVFFPQVCWIYYIFPKA